MNTGDTAWLLVSAALVVGKRKGFGLVGVRTASGRRNAGSSKGDGADLTRRRRRAPLPRRPPVFHSPEYVIYGLLLTLL